MREQAGRYSFDIGETNDGKQPRFYLGTNRTEAEIRRLRLGQLWESICIDMKSCPQWQSETLLAAHAIRQGQAEVVIPCPPQYDTNPQWYHDYIQHLNQAYKGIRFVPERPDVVDAATKEITAEFDKTKTQLDKLAKRLDKPAYSKAKSSLYDSIKAYAAWIRKEFVTPAIQGQQQQTSPHGNTLARQVERLMDCIHDCPLDADNFGYAQIEEMAGYFKKRPNRKGTDKPISVETVKAAIKTLKRFVKWIPKHYTWKKPEDWEDACKYNLKAMMNKTEIAARATHQQVTTYTVDELKIIWDTANQWQRLLFSLCINCGFGAAEVSTLRVDEVKPDGYIKRVRIKTGIYGEHWLYPKTEELLDWATERHDSIDKENPYLVIRKTGETLVKQTGGGNNSNKAANTWYGLTKKIRRKHPQFRGLSFGKLRKTGGDLIRQIADGECVAMLHHRGQTVSMDKQQEHYVNRPFPKLFIAQQAVNARLLAAGVFT